MTYKEYLTQLSPRRVLSVEVRPEECESIWANCIVNTKVVSLKIHNTFHTYVTKVESNRLWTIDQDGNPKSSSCFILIDRGGKTG